MNDEPPDRTEDLVSAHAAATSRVEDLRREFAAIEESTAAGPDDEHDAEGSTVGYERARVSALLDAAEASLGRIDDALERRDAGSYGRCTRCGTAIAPERLHALPAATRCTACAESGDPQGKAARFWKG